MTAVVDQDTVVPAPVFAPDRLLPVISDRLGLDTSTERTL